MKERTKNENRFSERFCSSGKADRFTQKGVFNAEFRVSTRRCLTAARSRAVALRGRAVRQEQRRNHPKEPLKIELSYGKWAVIDAEDFERLKMYKWCAVKESRNWYAKTLDKDCNRLALHRLVLNAPKGLVVDHIDHNGLNNRRSNLRLCTQTQNNCNMLPRKGCSSKYKGVSFNKARKRFVAYIQHNKKRFHLGYFEDEIDAAKAYDKAAKKFFGEFAYLNFP